MGLAHQLDQLALVGRDELETLGVEPGEVELPGRRVELSGAGGGECRGDGGQLIARALPEVPVRGGLPLELGQMVGARVRVAEQGDADEADDQQEGDEQSEKGRELRAYRDRDARYGPR